MCLIFKNESRKHVYVAYSYYTNLDMVNTELNRKTLPPIRYNDTEEAKLSKVEMSVIFNT